jgi:aconitate hydratase
LQGANYGQGSSREHAALAPVYLGVQGVVAKSFARIHKNNLINNGILPLIFKNEDDYDDIDVGDELRISDTRHAIEMGNVTMVNETKDHTYELGIEISERQREMLMAGGLINRMKANR